MSEDIDDAIDDEAVIDEATDVELSAEDRAMAMGWTPEGQFKGDPAKWVDAETFVKRGEEFLPFLKANNRRLEQSLSRAQSKIDAMDRGLKATIQQMSKAEQRGYEKARADLDAELDRFTDIGDAESVRAITRDIVKLETETINGTAEPVEIPALTEWKSANPWFGKDRAMTAAMLEIGQEVFDDGYGGAAQVRETDKRMREAFPERFAKPTNPNRSLPGAVEAGGSVPRRGGKSFADLPSDAKGFALELERGGTMKREEYAKEYFK